MKDAVNTAIGVALPYIFVPFWPLSILHRKIRSHALPKRVLLIARNSVAASHLVPVYDLLKGNSNVQLVVTTDRMPHRGFSRYQAENMVGPRSVHILLALLSHWDLIIFTNHPYGLGLCFPPWHKKLYVNHGLHTGKINNNLAQDGVYGRNKMLRPFNEPFYDCMFAASVWERDFAIKQTPELYDRIVIVGFLGADTFLDYVQENGMTARERLGFTQQQKIVHIISTWGENSLYAMCGQQLLQQITELVGQYAFLISIHPRFDSFSSGNSESRSDILTRFEQAGAKVNRALDWEDYVAASDVTLSDHSSLCLYHVLLEHPVLLVDVRDDQFMADSSFDLLNKRTNKLSNHKNLGDALNDLFSSTKRIDREILDRMLNYKGMALERYRTEIGILLETPLHKGTSSTEKNSLPP